MNSTATGRHAPCRVITVVGMSTVLPAIGECAWDVISDAEGFSAEGSAERDLEPHELEAFETAAAQLPPVLRDVGQMRIRGMATVDDETLWVYVHAVGPGPFDAAASRAAESARAELWSAIHTAAARL